MNRLQSVELPFPRSDIRTLCPRPLTKSPLLKMLLLDLSEFFSSCSWETSLLLTFKSNFNKIISLISVFRSRKSDAKTIWQGANEFGGDAPQFVVRQKRLTVSVSLADRESEATATAAGEPVRCALQFPVQTRGRDQPEGRLNDHGDRHLW